MSLKFTGIVALSAALGLVIKYMRSKQTPKQIEERESPIIQSFVNESLKRIENMVSIRFSDEYRIFSGIRYRVIEKISYNDLQSLLRRIDACDDISMLISFIDYTFYSLDGDRHDAVYKKIMNKLSYKNFRFKFRFAMKFNLFKLDSGLYELIDWDFTLYPYRKIKKTILQQTLAIIANGESSAALSLTRILRYGNRSMLKKLPSDPSEWVYIHVVHSYGYAGKCMHGHLKIYENKFIEHLKTCSDGLSCYYLSQAVTKYTYKILKKEYFDYKLHPKLQFCILVRRNKIGKPHQIASVVTQKFTITREVAPRFTTKNLTRYSLYFV